MNPESAIRKIRKSKHPYAVAIADRYGFELSMVKLTPANQQRFDKWLTQDKDYQARFVGVYDRTSSYAEMMEDVVFVVSNREAA